MIGNTITLLTLMGRSIQERTASVLQAEKPDLLNEVLAYVENHLSEKITLEETARYFYVSVSTITQLFRQKMGTSFYRCVTQRRLIAAKVRIGNGEALDDVSRAVGFADYSSFYRAFKKEYGISVMNYIGDLRLSYWRQNHTRFNEYLYKSSWYALCNKSSI